MSNVFVEGFATYGLGSLGAANSSVALAMLAGRWAQFTNSFNPGNQLSLETLPWAPTDPDIYLAGVNIGPNRVILPASQDAVFVSMYYAVANLPTTSAGCNICDFRNSSNQVLAALQVMSTGAVALWAGNSLLASTSGPALTAESAAHIELEFVASTGSINVQVNGTTVLNTSGLSLPFAGPNAQLGFITQSQSATDTNTVCFVGNLIIRSTAGSVNNGFVGDRRVVTLWPDQDNPSYQGWAGRPLHLWGTGVLDNTASGGLNTGVAMAAAASTDIGSQQFTIEGWFRFQALPTSANYATLFSKWDAGNNWRSYELYVGGPSLESGNTVFRISTDGHGATVNELIDWSYSWIVGEWYHVAIARDSSNKTRFFVNGVQQGLPVADSNTYYSGGAAAAESAIGCELSGGSPVNNTSFNGWQDEFRLTIGACRYTSDFVVPTGPFPRSGVDPDWSDVVLLCGWDDGVTDDSTYGRTLTADGGAAAITPNDGQFNYQTINQKTPTPDDNTFIEAALLAASNVLTYTALPTSGKIVTIATENGSTPAVYTWVTALTAAYQVLIGASINASMSNLVAAINAGPGSGTVYGTGTLANNDVEAQLLPTAQLEVTALVPGTAGNSLASTTNDTNASWQQGATLAGGANIPGQSRFGWSRLPSDTTIADSITILNRIWKTDSGVCSAQCSLIGALGGALNGANNSVTTAPTFYADIFEFDPDHSSNPLTPTAVTLSNVEINRTA